MLSMSTSSRDETRWAQTWHYAAVLAVLCKHENIVPGLQQTYPCQAHKQLSYSKHVERRTQARMCSATLQPAYIDGIYPHRRLPCLDSMHLRKPHVSNTAQVLHAASTAGGAGTGREKQGQGGWGTDLVQLISKLLLFLVKGG